MSKAMRRPGALDGVLKTQIALMQPSRRRSTAEFGGVPPADSSTWSRNGIFARDHEMPFNSDSSGRTLIHDARHCAMPSPTAPMRSKDVPRHFKYITNMRASGFGARVQRATRGAGWAMYRIAARQTQGIQP
jgi:hypothetical protein